MADTDAAWERLARQHPYWGVLSHDAYLGAELDAQAEAAFFASGARHVEHVLDTLRRLVPGYAPRVALDYGCGVGRLLLPLAGVCERVIGVDVSPTMLERAAARLDGAAVELLPAAALRSAPSVDLVHSALVFQHIHPRRGMVILTDLLDRLAPGGCGALQFHLRGGGAAARALRRLRAESDLVNAIAVRARRRPERDGLVLMYEYDAAAVLRALGAAGAGGVLVETTARADGDMHAMFYFTKAR